MLGKNPVYMDSIKHIAISLDDVSDWCRKNNISMNDGYAVYFDNLNRLIEFQVLTKIPIFTIYIINEAENNAQDYLNFCEQVAGFCDRLSQKKFIEEQKVKIAILGKWYNLPGKTVESIKNLMEATKDYDGFFVNLCINYDGQEEIVDACKLIAKQIQLGKIDAEMITKENIKENIYSSYFLPPDLLFVYGQRKLTGLLLWDSAKSSVAFADKSFLEFEEGDVKTYIFYRPGF